MLTNVSLLSIFLVSLSKQGSLEDIKIGDFGLADFYRPGQQGTSIQCGTLSFMSPEAFQMSSSKLGKRPIKT
jgi:serine/threonine protein kinase